ncbi:MULTISPECIES: hypothetical protein [Pseudofrankia]|uniref:hypothetical protein n=1 Tax=Pseudofrankia TaxID=2994363 RepID=UPI000234C79C|nr:MULTISPECIES: hypothetical protein [Pseudofrankia]OHV29151.1 hypothetical protein BCD49_36325 [Pseudofrankia sp. EUN1h]
MQTDDTSPAVGDDGVAEAARAIRPYLDELIGPRAAAGLDRQLADTLLGPADPAERTRRLRDLLDTNPTTSRFLMEVLTDPPHFRPPYQQPHYHHRTAGSGSPLGDPSPATADRYTCPHGDYVWYRPDVGTPVPTCKTHQTQLTRS